MEKLHITMKVSLILKAFVLFFFFVLLSRSMPSLGQTPDSAKTFMGSNMGMDSLIKDTTKIIEDAALDIGQNRGLFIVTPGGEMQLRILGSVRYLVVYDDINLESKNSLSTYEISVG
jgi:hypothetical protein